MGLVQVILKYGLPLRLAEDPGLMSLADVMEAAPRWQPAFHMTFQSLLSAHLPTFPEPTPPTTGVGIGTLFLHTWLLPISPLAAPTACCLGTVMRYHRRL